MENPVRELQRTLYRVARAQPARRFHSLHDKINRPDVLREAWRRVRANGGSVVRRYKAYATAAASKVPAVIAWAMACVICAGVAVVSSRKIECKCCSSRSVFVPRPV